MQDIYPSYSNDQSSGVLVFSNLRPITDKLPIGWKSTLNASSLLLPTISLSLNSLLHYDNLNPVCCHQSPRHQSTHKVTRAYYKSRDPISIYYSH